MKKQRAIPVVCAALLIETFIPRPVEAEPPAREYQIEREVFTTAINPIVVEAAQIIVEPVSSIYYAIPLTDSEQDSIREIASKFEIEFELVLAICQTETNFTTDCIGDYGNSYGIMQIQPRWWTSLFNEYGCSYCLSLEDNITVGCAILRYLYNSYGDTRSVLNAYNTSNPNCNNGYADKVLMNIENLERR